MDLKRYRTLRKYKGNRLKIKGLITFAGYCYHDSVTARSHRKKGKISEIDEATESCL